MKAEHVEKEAVCISFDNGYLQDMAERYGATIEVVGKALKYSNDAAEFLVELDKRHVAVPASDVEWLESGFLKVRLREHTFRAVYRLSVLGVIDDFEVDYSGGTVTAWLRPLPEGGCRDRLRMYVGRYAPMDVRRYLEVAHRSPHRSELRRCLHALIQFVYARIEKQRSESLLIMEQTTRRGLENANAFSEAVTTFFNSKYIPVLRPYLNEYTPELFFTICQGTAMGHAQVSHLLGACNRLLPENPENAVFHALRAFSLAVLGYDQQAVKTEVDESLAGFELYHSWGRNEKLDFLTKVRALIAEGNPASARVFDACIIEDHTSWLRQFELDLQAVEIKSTGKA
jgi:ATP-dependent DNA helicase RecQ